MSQSIPSKNIEKAIVKGAKKVIAESGLSSSTRSGNKELSYWANSLSAQSFPNIQTAFQFGESLGRNIVELSQASNKQYLDSGVIRQLRSQKKLPAVPANSASPASAQPIKEASAKTAPAAKHQPAVQPKPENEATSIATSPKISHSVEKVEVSEDPMSDPAKEPVSIPVEKPKTTEEAATVGAVEDDEVIPANSEAAKVEIDPDPAIESVPEEPKSVAETVAQEEAIVEEA